MTVTATHRDRLADIRARLAGARRAHKSAMDVMNAAKRTQDTHMEAVAQEGLSRTSHDIEVAENLERVLLSQMSGTSSFGGGFGTESAFDDPQTVGMLERLADSKMPIGAMDLGPVCSTEQYVAMLESGSWGSPRMAVNNSDPDIPTTARQTTYFGIVPQARRRLRLLDLIPTSPMDGRSFDFTREGGAMDGTAAETAEGALKPGSDITLTDGQVIARTVAAYLKLKRQQLSDVPALSQTANDRLLYQVNRRLENQIVAGDGTGENILGVLNTSGIGAEAFTTGDVLADDVSRGIRDVLLADLEPNAVIINPTDLQSIWIAKAAGSGQYFGGGPFAASPDNLWGLPAISSKVMPAGQALVGDFTNGARLFIREAPNLRISDADQDDFLRNQVTMLAEMRAGLAIWQPSAFCLVHLAGS